jgi:hypothetical protein
MIIVLIVGIGIFLSNNGLVKIDNRDSADLVDLRMQKYKTEIEKVADEIKTKTKETQENDIPDDASMAAELMAVANSYKY